MLRVEEHVFRLDVTMYNTLIVKIGERKRKLKRSLVYNKWKKQQLELYTEERAHCPYARLVGRVV